MLVQILYARGETRNGSAILGISHSLPAWQAEENVVCNLACSVTYLDSVRHLVARRGVLGREVHLPGLAQAAGGQPKATSITSKQPLLEDHAEVPARGCVQHRVQPVP